MAKKHKHEEHENLERWLVSYGDFITLLFATFVVLYALAQVDATDFAKLEDSLKNAFSQGQLFDGQQAILDGSDSLFDQQQANSFIPSLMLEYISPKYEDDSFKEIDTEIKELTELMVGRSVSLAIDRPNQTISDELLNVHHLSVCDEHGVERLKDVSFDLKAGEVLGVAGVAGSGQKELCEAIAGLRSIHKGAILFKKENIEGKTPREIIKLGIGMSFIPEDRLGMGLAASLSITDNMILENYHRGKSPFINRKNAAVKAQDIVDRYQVVTPSVSTSVRKLSGGNVQKVLLGREIDAAPSVLITAYAVRGLDIHSSYMIYDEINKQKQNGVGVLFVGEDLDVMLELCDRILVLCQGEITGIVDAKTTTKEQLGFYMTGSVKEAGEA